MGGAALQCPTRQLPLGAGQERQIHSTSLARMLEYHAHLHDGPNLVHRHLASVTLIGGISHGRWSPACREDCTARSLQAIASSRFEFTDGDLIFPRRLDDTVRRLEDTVAAGHVERPALQRMDPVLRSSDERKQAVPETS